MTNGRIADKFTGLTVHPDGRRVQLWFQTAGQDFYIETTIRELARNLGEFVRTCAAPSGEIGRGYIPASEAHIAIGPQNEQVLTLTIGDRAPVSFLLASECTETLRSELTLAAQVSQAPKRPN